MMQNKRVLLGMCSWTSLASFAGGAVAQPSTEVCGDAGGPEICVRFDNFSDPPEETVDFRFDLASPANPSVELLRGRDTQGTLYAWRVWSWDAQENAANIGSITTPGEYDYEVKIANKYDGAGALDVGSAELLPDGAGYYSSVASGSKISGDLTGDLTLQKSSGGEGGAVTLTVQVDPRTQSPPAYGPAESLPDVSWHRRTDPVLSARETDSRCP